MSAVRIIFNVMSYCCMMQDHLWIGKLGSMENMPAVKWFFYVWIARLAALVWWICGCFSWNLSSTSVIRVFKALRDLLSKWCSYGLKPCLTSFYCIALYTVSSFVSDLLFMGWDRMAFASTQYTIIKYFFLFWIRSKNDQFGHCIRCRWLFWSMQG